MPSPLVARLSRVPDARRSRLPLFEPAFLPYAALMIGAAPAAVVALWNAVGVRRWRPAALALVCGVAGWVGFGIIIQLLLGAGWRSLSLAIIVARLANLGFGLLLARSQWAYARGHRFLGGRAVPLLPAVVVTLVVTLVLPSTALLATWGAWQLLV
jgi:hypothetical protein